MLVSHSRIYWNAIWKKKSDVAGYLRVLIDWNDDNDTISLKQSDLAQRVVEALYFDDDTSSVETLAASYLPLDEDGEPPQVFITTHPLLAC